MDTRVEHNRVEVWDLFIRIFHWGLVLSFAVTYATGDEWRGVHTSAGYGALALIGVRVVWGFIGPAYTRFSQFVKSPAAITAYLTSMYAGREARYLGHNPAGGLMVIVLIVLISAVCISGILLTTEMFWGSDSVDGFHSTLADLAVACVAVHVTGVFITSIRTRENLVWSMLTGTKRAPIDEDVR